MKDPQDCTYPQEALCLHDCKQECQKRSGWRKAQIDDAEEEAWKELEKASAMREVQRLGQEIEQKIGCVNHDCEQCKAQRTEEKNA